ncbi:restriction endonuclease subunit S [Yersinia similis]|uniref:restriction endonuclease subunit S n=1 Tax=Yersinia similis TaxID=367190 RepID=UPI0011A399DC|nr:restriction endonuclease subunit S [Yersinia similis]
MSSKVPLSQIAEIVMGQSPKGEEVNNKGIGLPLLNGPTEFTERYPIPVQHTAYAKKTSLPGDILFCVRGSTTGRMNYSDQKYCIGRGLAAIRGRNGYPTPYIKAILEAYLPELLAAATGSTFPNVSKDLINNILVEVLPVANACYISKFIEAQEEKVFNSNQINKTLEQIAQALFKSWFVDFEPVKAKIAVLEAGGSQEEAILAAMTAISGKDADSLAVFEREYPEQYAELKATAELFPSAMQESELGEIPVGWKFSSLEDVTSLIIDHRGKTPKKLGGDWSEDGHPAISAKNIKNGRLVRHDAIRYVDSNLYAKWMKDTLLAGDILMTSEAPLGELMYLAKDCDYLLSQRLYGIRADKEIISGCYLYFWLQTSAAKADIDGRATGSTVVGIRQSELRKVNVMAPQKAVVESFSSLTTLYLAKIESNEKQNIVLEKLRDTLLPKLLSGEITLPEAEQAVSEAENV